VESVPIAFDDFSSTCARIVQASGVLGYLKEASFRGYPFDELVPGRVFESDI
jgi:hypothetical protein